MWIWVIISSRNLWITVVISYLYVLVLKSTHSSLEFISRAINSLFEYFKHWVLNILATRKHLSIIGNHWLPLQRFYCLFLVIPPFPLSISSLRHHKFSAYLRKQKNGFSTYTFYWYVVLKFTESYLCKKFSCKYNMIVRMLWHFYQLIFEQTLGYYSTT